MINSALLDLIVEGRQRRGDMHYDRGQDMINAARTRSDQVHYPGDGDAPYSGDARESAESD